MFRKTAFAFLFITVLTGLCLAGGFFEPELIVNGTLQEMRRLNENGQLLMQRTYNRKGFMICEENFWDGNSVGRSDFKVNGKGLVLSESYFDGNGDMYSGVAYSYVGGNLDSLEYQDGNGEITGYSMMEYSGGVKTREVGYSADGSIRNVRDFTYDANGNLTQIDTYNIEGEGVFEINADVLVLYESIACEYNAAGQMIKEIYSYNGSVGTIIEYAYDNNGNVSGYAEKSPSGEVYMQMEYEYTYDEMSNVTKMVTKFVSDDFEESAFFEYVYK